MSDTKTSLSLKERVVRFLEDHRVWLLTFFVLPASYIFNLVLSIKKYFLKLKYADANEHDNRVKEIQQKIEAWNKLPPEGRKLLCTSRANWLSLSLSFFRKDLCHKIPIDLYNILELNEEQLTVRVEPMVSVSDITKYLVPKGYTLAVTLEVGDATLGGLAIATGMTTHSHKVGLYQENIVSYEVILSDGSLVIASEKDNPKLYRTLCWSHGSLAFLVALTLKIVKIKPYLRMEYIPVRGQDEYIRFIQEKSGALSSDSVCSDYVEATIFNHDEAVVMVGDYSDYDPNIPVNYVSRWYKPWFYKYVERFLKKGKSVELIPLRDYLLRHNRSLFWVIESMIPFGNHPIFRFFFGWLLPPKPAFLKFTTTPGIRAYTFVKQVFQDIVLPLNRLKDQIDTAERLFETFPLLVYPCRVYDHGDHSGQIKQPRKEYLVPGSNYAMYNDLGIYGVPGKLLKKEKYNAVETMREMEKFTRDVGGFSFLYADIFMTREEFEEMFDLTLYEEVRKEYKAENAFPHLYEKVRPEIDIFEVGKQYSES